MTNKDAVIATLQITGYSDSAIDKALLDAGLNGSDTYKVDNTTGIGKVAIEVLQSMLSLASVSEGNYHVSYSLAGIKLRLDYLNTLYGLIGGPIVRGASVW